MQYNAPHPDPGATAGEWTVVSVPFWFVAALTAAAPTAWLLRHLTRRHRRVKGLCPACGYDWRATPGRCPECGSTTAASTTGTTTTGA